MILGFVSPGYTLWGTRIAPYRPISQPISGLGLGATGPVMNAGFVVGGLVLAAGVIATFQSIPQLSPRARWACTALLPLSPLGMVVCGIFTLQSMMLHLAGFLLAAATPVLGFLIAGVVLRRIPRWHRFGDGLLIASPLTLTLLVLYVLTFSPTVAGIESGVAGLTQRVAVIEVHAWFVALGWLAFRRS